MTGEEFREWLKEMVRLKLATSDADCARLLGRSPQWVVKAKKAGTDATVAIACRGLLHRMGRYPQ